MSNAHTRSRRQQRQRATAIRPDLIWPKIMAEVLAHDEDMTRQRLTATEAAQMVEAISYAWFTERRPNDSLLTFIRRWLGREYNGWCDAHGCRP